jgi:UDP-N-acetyl-D-glucosamine dehydrogenase
MNTPSVFENILEKIERRNVKVGVIGLGYVGLPLCFAIVESGLNTLGFEIDTSKLKALSGGHSYISEFDDKKIAEVNASGKFAATCDFGRIVEPDVLIICVPTPITKENQPDLSYLLETTETIALHLRPGQLVVLESTTYPGTTHEVIRPMLESSGLKNDEDFFLAFSPERTDPANKRYTTSAIPKVIGADSKKASILAETFYKMFINTVVPVSNTRTAEMVKLTENIFRAVNIALINEIKIISEALDVDIWEVVDAAKTKPFGFMAFYPGPGLGGHCIPVDPMYLIWKAKEHNVPARLIELAAKINSKMPYRVIDSLERELNLRFGKDLSGSKILILGVGYKKNVDDVRESPALKIFEMLEKRGVHVEFYDPNVLIIPINCGYANLVGRESVTWKLGMSGQYDAVLILTDHDEVEYHSIVSSAQLVVDTRNACRKSGVYSSKIAMA